MKIGLLQLNPVVGDLEGNAQRIQLAVEQAQSSGAQLCVTPEMALLGYPPRDLLLYPEVIRRAQRVMLNLAIALEDAVPVIVGAPEANLSGVGKPMFNSAYLLMEGEIVRTFRKTLLPTYDVFDEARYFESAESCSGGAHPRNTFRFMDKRIGVTICEDAWNDKDFHAIRTYHNDPVERISKEPLDVVINMAASPFSVGKQQMREAMLGAVAKKHHFPMVYVNQVGGNDDLVFDGRSMALDKKGELFARASGFNEETMVVDLGNREGRLDSDDFCPESETYRALVAGLRDYLIKSGFSRAVIGLSGGVDSALTAALAVHALGRGNVMGVLMPSPHSSQGSIDDSLELAKRLGIRTYTLPIDNLMDCMQTTLEKPFTGYEPDVTEENIQARLRGNLLMAISNKTGSMVLATGNKSELSVGYCTMYGDMAGGFAPIADLPKTAVYRLASWMNREFSEPIPQPILEKAPTAELRPDQSDQDSLPDYTTLDAILHLHIEERLARQEIVSQGFDAEIVNQVLDMVKKAEFKRHQAVPGVKIQARSFGSGWRMPVACKNPL
ncbi:NAD+ synthase (glutamine-hydrolysing) [Paucidesulfovibrio gracilis DSM 16080]|uniref:Glutamine-dependent NAD(+) synthetase n=1 Tax=Paucidesulfovibrio gracilis DSM 16080 TaxID=1121449 RepID=A0A1T4XPF3_9BACT|nr:NAD+ synthase [Paucidesulfovibrio gracilis]SKA90945.1 NAD+ synthase (glutamine-hydrolysing) [Paucidesulfovibrio gracilis DSM 16080]